MTAMTEPSTPPRHSTQAPTRTSIAPAAHPHALWLWFWLWFWLWLWLWFGSRSMAPSPDPRCTGNRTAPGYDPCNRTITNRKPVSGISGQPETTGRPAFGNTVRKSQLTRNAFWNVAPNPLYMGHEWQQTARKKRHGGAPAAGKKEPPARSGGKRQKKARTAEPFEVLCEKHTGKSRSMSGKKY